MAERKFCPYCMSPLKEGEACPVCGLTEGSYESKPHHLPPGTVLIDKYLVGRVLGEGGFGITYIGCDLRLEMKVAIKELFPSERVTRVASASLNVTSFSGASTELFGQLKERFLREARMMAKMVGQREIVTVKDYFEANNTAYIVMEYVDGTNLKELVEQRGGHIPAGELLHFIEPLFGALSAMHDIGLIHRDIKPENLMLSSGRIRLLDFGCARENVIGQATISIILTPGYAPIEQYQGHNMGPWTDVYSLAATMYFCLTGKMPPQSMDRMIEDELIPPRQLGAALTRSQEAALLYGMGLRPQKRFQSMQEFHTALYVGPWPPEPEKEPSLTALKIGSLELSPAFDPKVTNYTADTTEAESEITATPSDPDAKAELKLKGEAVTSPVTWADGKNALRIQVRNTTAEKTYTVTVNKRKEPEPNPIIEFIKKLGIPIWSLILLGIAAVILITVLILANIDDGGEQKHTDSSTEPTIEVTEETTEPTAEVTEETAEPATEPSALGILASGVCAKNLSWALDDDGTLTVSGTGDMYHFAGDKAPWYDYRDRIQKVVMESGVTSVSDHAFSACPNLTAVELPDTLVSIEAGAFYKTSLAAVTIPASVTSIGEAAFSDCLMTEITVEAGNTAYTSAGGVLFTGDMTTLLCYPGGKAGEYSVPDSVTYIAGAAFDGCESLTSVTIPASVTSIGENAFAGCDSLTDVSYGGTKAEREGIAIADGNTCLTNAAWHCAYATSGACGQNLSWALDNGTLTVSGSGEMTEYATGSSPWYDARELITSVIIEDGVTTVGDYAFYGCAKLTSVSLPGSVTELGTGAFAQCTSLTSFTVSDGVTVLSGYVFDGCESLTEITLPAGVSVGYCAFSKCEALRDVHYKGGETDHVSISAQNDCLTNAAWDYAYYASGTFGDNLTWMLGNDGTLTVSGAGAMSDCGSAKDVPWYDYRGSIVKVVLEGSITNIGERAFYKCILLTDVTIPESVKTVGAFAFYGDKELTAVHYGGSELSRMDALEIGSNNEPLTSAAWDYAKASDADALLAKKTELLFADAQTFTGDNSNWEDFVAMLNDDSVSAIIIPESCTLTTFAQVTITKPVLVEGWLGAWDTMTVDGENACIYLKGNSSRDGTLNPTSVVRTVNGGRIIVDDGGVIGEGSGAFWLESDSDLIIFENGNKWVQDDQIAVCSERELRSKGTQVSTAEEFTAAINGWNTKAVIVTGDITVDANGASCLGVSVPIIIDEGASLTVTNTSNSDGWDNYLWTDQCIINYGTLNAFVASENASLYVNYGTWTCGTFNCGAILVNYGSMTATNSYSCVKGSEAINSGTLGDTGHFFNEGTLTVTGGFHFADGILCNCNSGTIVVNGTISLNNGVNAFNNGSIQVSSGGNVYNSACLYNVGTISIAVNCVFINDGVLINQGSLRSAGGFYNSDGLILTCEDASFSVANRPGGRIETIPNPYSSTPSSDWTVVTTGEELAEAMNDPSVQNVYLYLGQSGDVYVAGDLTVTKPLVTSRWGWEVYGKLTVESGYVVAYGTGVDAGSIELENDTFLLSTRGIYCSNISIGENAALYYTFVDYSLLGENGWYNPVVGTNGKIEIDGGTMQILCSLTLENADITITDGGTLKADSYVTFEGCDVEIAENSLLSLDAYWLDENTIVTNNGYMDLSLGSETDFRMEGRLTNNGAMLISHMWVYGVLENNGRIYFSSSYADHFTTKGSGEITGNEILTYTDGMDWKNG